MQNHHLSKKKQLAVRFFTYGIMTVATVLVSIVCILLVLGYRFDFGQGTVEQGGLLQFRSFPSDASITLDGKKLNFRTPGKQNVDAGDHSVTFDLQGYEQWSKTFSIIPGELRWLNYARMVPTDITTQSVDTIKTATDGLASPDRKWYVVQAAAAEPVLKLYDLDDPTEVTSATLTLPEDVPAVAEDVSHSYQIVEWDIGSRYVLLKHIYGNKSEFLRVDRTDVDNTVNISELFGITIRHAQFIGDSGGQLYVMDAENLRRVNISNKTISSPLVRGVTAFELYKDEAIAFVAKRNENVVAGFYDNEETIIRTYKDAAVDDVYIDVTSYFDREYMMVGVGKTVEILRDPSDSADVAGRTFAAFELEKPIGWVQFANNGRFAVVGNGTTFSTYDIETDEQFESAFPGAFSSASRNLPWLDDYYLVSQADGKVRIGEFDGANQHDITSASSRFPVTLSDNGEWLFSVAETEDGSYQLQRSRLVLQD